MHIHTRTAHTFGHRAIHAIATIQFSRYVFMQNSAPLYSHAAKIINAMFARIVEWNSFFLYSQIIDLQNLK